MFCFGTVACDDTPDASLRDDLMDALHEAKYSQKAAALDAGLDASLWSRYCASGTVPFWRLLKLNADFWRAFLPRIARRYGLAVVDADQAQAVHAVISVARAVGRPSA